MLTKNGKIIYQAQFHPLLIRYYLVYVGLIFLCTVAGIVLLPFWFMGIGAYFCRRYYNSLECTLTEHTLEMKKGYVFRTEKTIPLNKIQDLTLKEGPLLRVFDTCILQVETAGQVSEAGQSDMRLVGIKDARKFRDLVLEQRDKTDHPSEFVKTETEDAGIIDLLTDIRNTLHQIQKSLSRQE